jgi:hypothetical protein
VCGDALQRRLAQRSAWCARVDVPRSLLQALAWNG